MSFFKKKDKLAIPPVPEPASMSRSTSSSSTAPPSYRSHTSATYVASRDGDMYNTGYVPPGPMPSYGDRYARQNAVGDVYSRGQGDIEQDRNALFSGLNKEKVGSGRFFNDGPAGPRGIGEEPPAGEENEEDVEGIKQQLRFTKQESLASTRNALRLAREAEETARNTMGKLGTQSEKLADTERHLDVSKGHSQRADDRTDELKQLNRSIFRPVITWNKDAKRAAEEARIQQRYEEEREERERAATDIRQTQDRLGRAATYGRTGEEGSGRFRTAEQLNARKDQRKRYQFEASNSDDELEDELDDNLDEISDVTKRLKALGSAMGQELDGQNDRITRITDKTDNLDSRLFRNTQRLNKIK